MMVTLEDLCVTSSTTLRKALSKINDNAQGMLFTTEKQKLIGVLTDGDVRRALIQGASLDDPVSQFCNRDFIALHKDASVQEIQRTLSPRVKIVPLLDSDGKIVDYASSNRITRIPVLEPLLGGNELEYVTECITTNWVSSQGKFVQQFEKEIKDYTGSDYALAVSNGTVALHLALVSLGIGSGDEVIVPDITFGATLNAVILSGATPVLVDVDKKTWNMSLSQLEQSITDKTRAIMPVHIYGAPCDMRAIMDLAVAHDLKVVEDCAEALGSKINRKHVGTFGDIGTFSFFGNKVITCGEGGAILFKEQAIYERAKILRDHGMSPGRRYWHEEVGFNYRLTNLQAALGCAQFEQLPAFLKKRQEIYAWYTDYLSSSELFEFQELLQEHTTSNWLFTVLLKKDSPIERDELIRKLAKLGIETRPMFYPMSVMPAFDTYPTNLIGNSVDIAARGISLPTSVYLSKEEVRYISEKVIDVIMSQHETSKILSECNDT